MYSGHVEVVIVESKSNGNNLRGLYVDISIYKNPIYKFSINKKSIYKFSIYKNPIYKIPNYKNPCWVWAPKRERWIAIYNGAEFNYINLILC